MTKRSENEVLNTFKAKKERLEEIGEIYKKTKIFNNEHYVAFLNEQRVLEKPDAYVPISEEKLKYYSMFKFVVDSVLNLVDAEFERILRKDFFEKQGHFSWWRSYYSRSTYYRLKSRAMEEFLKFFYS